MKVLTHHAEVLCVQQAAFSLAQMLVPGHDLETSSQLPQVLSGHVVRVRRLMLLLVSLRMMMVLPLPETAAPLAPLVA